MKEKFFTQKFVPFIAVLLLVAALFNGIQVHAQIPASIWGIEGAEIYSVDSIGNNLQLRHDFSAIAYPGGMPYGSVIVYNGKLYGVTYYGGANNDGVIFSYDTTTGIATDLYDFDGTHGSLPSGSLVVYNNQMYGMAGGGGANNDGVVFSFDPATNLYTDVYDFDGTHGSGPYYGALVAYNSKLYGMTEKGGANADGVIFSLDPSTNTYTDIFDFSATTGKNPYGSLMVYNSELYGTTELGGANNAGVIFSFDPATNTYVDVYDLTSATGSRPYNSLVTCNNKLYGMTELGGANNYGAIYSFDPSTNTYADIYDFNDDEGGRPYGDLLVTGNKLYGMTKIGGANTEGVLFSFNTADNTFTDIYDFSDQTGGYTPYGGLLLCNSKLYGMTTTGGGGGAGTLFSFDTLTNNYVTLEAFGATSGSLPDGLMTLYNNDLYGTTTGGGLFGFGVIYSVDPLTGDYTVLHTFDINNNGASNLAVYGSKLWGTAGGSGNGSIFSYNQATNAFTVEYSFASPVEGGNQHQLCPYNGKLYAVTQSAGTNNFGQIYSFDTATSAYTSLYSFDSSVVASSDLTVYNHKLYGTTELGGANGFGMIYSFDPAANTFTDVYDFDNTHGGQSGNNDLYADTINQKLYGTTGGGANNDGVIFSFAPASGTYTDLYDFVQATNAFWGQATLTEYKGKLWGSTTTGDTTFNGLLFSIDTNGTNFAVSQNYTAGGGTYVTVVPAICLLQAAAITANGAILSTGIYNNYQWYLNGQAINNAINQSYTAVANGIYYVVVSDTGGCSKQSVADTITNLSVASVAASNAAVQIYPNPNNGTFTVTGNIISSKDADIEVLNAIGQKVYEVKVPVANGVINKEVQLPQTDASGIYLLHITTDNGSTVVRVVIEK